MLSFRMLGAASLFIGEQLLDEFRSRKEAALLFYLAQTGEAQERAVIADLLWDDRTTKQALGNLRTVIARLRKQVGDELQVTRTALALAPTSRHEVDSRILLETLVAFGQVDSVEKADALLRALDAYRGDFLAGFSLPDAPQFDAWVTTTREEIRREVLAAYAKVGQFVLAHGSMEAGLTIARRWLAVDELDEGAHMLLLRLLLDDGQTRAAAAHYDACVRLLRTELGVAPSPELTALFDRLPSTTSMPVQPAEVQRRAVYKSPARARHNLPAPHDEFFGRTDALADIDARLDQPWCRLVTLSGQGGVGKTRLAVTVAHRRLSRYRDGAWLVELAEIDPDDADLTEAIAVEIAIAVNLHLTGAAKPVAQLLEHLKYREILLVLDNCEHVLAGVTQLALDLIRQCEGVQLLVTAREALHIRAEWTIALSGLSYPQDERDETPSDAVDLFLARRAQWRRDALTSDNRAAVRHICRLVGGLPLAVELAAALTREASARSIADDLSHGFGVLATTLKDVPQRHRSLQIVFEMSWRSLTPTLQTRLARLSVFRSGFTRTAAQQIADAEEAHLTALCGKSLLTYEPASKRYSFHPVVHAYAAEKLADMPVAVNAEGANSERVNALLESHARYYLDVLIRQTETMQGSQPQHAVALVEPDMDNVRLAWQTALAMHLADLLLEALPSLSIYHQLRGLAYEGEATMQATTRTATAWGAHGVKLASRAGLELARFQNRLGRFRQAIAGVEAALQCAGQSDDLWAEGMGHVLWGEALWRLGEYAEAEKKLDHAHAIARAIDSVLLVGWCHHHLGVIDDIQSRYASADAHLQLACDAWRAIDNAQALSNSLNSVAIVRYNQGNLPAAQDAMEQALAICEQIDDRHRQSNLFNNLSMIATEQGDYAGAHYYLQFGLNLATATGDLYVQGGLYNNLAKNYRLMGNLDAAERTLSQGMPILDSIGDPMLRATALFYLGETKREQGDRAEAESCYAQALEIARRDRLEYIECEVLTSMSELLSRQDERKARQSIAQAIALAEAMQNAHLLKRAVAIADYLGVPVDKDGNLSV